eukprot:scaffold7888_cov117-Skeletonema_menzelii.AAC.1
MKVAVDPGFMFNCSCSCSGCIGNNLDVAMAPEVPPVQPSGASLVSTYAAAIFASVTVLFSFLFLTLCLYPKPKLSVMFVFEAEKSRIHHK